MKKIIIIIFFILGTCSVTYAGNVAETFSKSIFELKWLSSKEEVIKKYPHGKLKTTVGVKSYIIKDGRTLFGVERKKENYISFVFNGEDQLSGVSIQFPMESTDDFGELLIKLNTYFGSAESKPNSFGVVFVQWPEDSGIKISLTTIPGVFSSELLFNVEYTTPIQVEKEKFDSNPK